jgi:hypothetical protein
MPPPREVTGLHIPVVAFLNRFMAEGWEFTHPATGEHRRKAEGHGHQARLARRDFDLA